MSASGTFAGLGLSLALLLGVAGSPFAQSGPGGGDPEGGPGGHHRTRLEGPPAPATLRDSIGLNPQQVERYTQRYSTYMAETKPARDSLRATMKEIRTAFESGDRSEARDRRNAVKQQAEALTKKDQQFEKTLRDGLPKDQQARYDTWKKAREAADRERHQHNRHRQPGNL
jgi:heavy-metal resistance protein